VGRWTLESKPDRLNIGRPRKRLIPSIIVRKEWRPPDMGLKKELTGLIPKKKEKDKGLWRSSRAYSGD